MPKSLVMSVLAFIIASGGTYGGYKVVKDYKNYGADFETRPHKVVRVIDGDTIQIENKIKIRLLGINAPDKRECYYKEAKAYLKEQIEGQEVFLEKDITAKGFFGRLLRYVIVRTDNPEADTRIINNELIRTGNAFTLSDKGPDKKYRDLLATSQRKAREERVGLWSSECNYFDEYKDAKSLREKGSEPPSKNCTIKGNISEKGYGKLYFLEGCPNYSRVKVDERKGEAWFCSEVAAQKAGFKRSESCDNTF